MNSMTHSAKQREKFRAIHDSARFGRTRAGFADGQLSERFPIIEWLNRFDPFEGVATDPQSLHKYAYVHGDPVNGIDPRGEFFGSTSVAFGGSILSVLLGAAFTGAISLPVAFAAGGIAFAGLTLLDAAERYAGGTPDASQAASINRGLALIPGNTTTAIAKRTSTIQIEVGTNPIGPESWGFAPTINSDRIILSPKSFKLDNILLASLIVHETTHTFYGLGKNGLFGLAFTTEPQAYQAQSDFLRKQGINGTPTQVKRLLRQKSGQLSSESNQIITDLFEAFKDYDVKNPAIHVQ